MYIQIVKKIDKVVVRDSDRDRSFIGSFDYSKHSTEIDYIIANLLPTEAILPNNVYKLALENQVKIYRILLTLNKSSSI